MEALDVQLGVVRILTAQGQTAGTGFLVSPQGLVVTCTHVLDVASAADRVWVDWPLAERFGGTPACVLVEHSAPAAAEDIGFIQLDEVPPGIRPFRLGNTAGAVDRAYRTFGFPEAKPVDGMPGRLDVVGRTREGGFEVLQFRSSEVSRGFSGAPVWDDQGFVVGVVVSVAVPDTLGRTRDTAFVRPVELVLELMPDLRPQGAQPYRGLDVFQDRHAKWYFGREAAIEELTRLIVRESFVAIVGVSGSGKSSLVRAGLTKGLAESEIPGLSRRARCVMQPGPSPLANLTHALGALPEPTRVGDGMSAAAAGRPALDDVAGLIRERAPDGLILIIDQFERLYIDCPDDALQQEFIDTVLAVTGDDVTTTITLRADFFGLALGHAELAVRIERGQLTLLPMTDEELRRSIEAPAERELRSFEPGLPERLVADVRGRPGDLPLLEFALTEIWNRDAAGGVLTHATYQGLGYAGHDGLNYSGVSGAIAVRADAIWTDLDRAERRAARRVFLSLIAATTPAAGTDGTVTAVARRAWLSEFDPDARAVAGKLAEMRLLTAGEDPSSGQPTIEVAHEALLRAWPTLARWVADSGPFVAWRDRELTPLWRLWEDNDHDPELLLPSAKLEEARRFRDDYAEELPDPYQEYIAASLEASAARLEREARQLVTTRRMNRRLRAFTLLLGLLVIVAGASAFYAQRQADRADTQRQVAVSRSLATSALANLDSRIDFAGVLSLEAYRVARTFEARDAVLTTLARLTRERQVLVGPPSFAIGDAGIAFSRDGRTVAASGYSGVAFWDVRTGRSAREPLGSNEGSYGVEFSPDGKRVALAGYAGANVWEYPSGKDSAVADVGFDDTVFDVAFSPDGKTLATSTFAGRVGLWDITTARPRAVWLNGRGKAMRDLAWEPGGETLAAVGDDGVLRWNVRTHEPIGRPLTGAPGQLSTVAFSPDATLLAAGGIGGTIWLWDAKTSDQLPSLVLPEGHSRVKDIAFSPDGQRLVAAYHNKTLRVWSMSSHKILSETSATASSVAISSNGRIVASADGKVQLWTLDRLQPVGAFDRRIAANYSIGGTRPRFAAADTRVIHADDSGVHSWDSRTGRIVADTPAPPDSFYEALGAHVAVLKDGGRQSFLWNTHSGTPIRALPRDIDADLEFGAISPDGKLFAASGKRVRLYDIVRGRTLADLGPVPYAQANVLAFSPDGRTLARPNDDGGVQLWNLTSRKPLPVKLNHDNKPVLSLAFSHDGRMLATGSDDGALRLWSTSNWRLLGAPITPAAEGINGVAFSPDGSTLATVSLVTLRFWDVASRRQLGTPQTIPDEYFDAVAFGAKNESLLTIDGDEVIHIWDPILWSADLESLRRRVCALVTRDLTPPEWRQLAPDLPYRKTCRG